MSEIIYNSVGLICVVLALVYLNIASAKIRIILSSTLFVLFIIKTISSVILGESLVLVFDIICAIIWAIGTILSFLVIKIEKSTTPPDFDFGIIDMEPEDNEDVIDVDYIEVQKDSNE